MIEEGKPIPEVRIIKDNGDAMKSFSVAVMGLTGVGKSSIVNSLLNRSELKGSNKDGRGKEIDDRQMTVCNVTLSFFESNCNMVQGTPSTDIVHIMSANVFILVFAVNKLDSYEYVEQLKDTIRDIQGHDVAIVVVGNKHDVSKREIGFALIDCIVALDWEIPYVEVSTKTGYNVNLILPYLFRNESLSRYRHLFQTNADKLRRRSTGYDTSDINGSPRRRTYSVFALSPFKKAQKDKQASNTDTRPKKKKSTHPRRMSLMKLIACNENEQSPEMCSRNIRDDPEDGSSWRTRSNSMSTIREGREVDTNTVARCRGARRASLATDSPDVWSKKKMALIDAESRKRRGVMAASERTS